MLAFLLRWYSVCHCHHPNLLEILLFVILLFPWTVCLYSPRQKALGIRSLLVHQISLSEYILTLFTPVIHVIGASDNEVDAGVDLDDEDIVIADSEVVFPGQTYD